MEKETKFLNAKEARARSDLSYSLKNHVYKRIKEASSENFTEIQWCIEELSDVAVSDLISDLRSNGYDVSFQKYYDESGVEVDTDEGTIVIKW